MLSADTGKPLTERLFVWSRWQPDGFRSLLTALSEFRSPDLTCFPCLTPVWFFSISVTQVLYFGELYNPRCYLMTTSTARAVTSRWLSILEEYEKVNAGQS